jgi:hypothetical protein
MLTQTQRAELVFLAAEAGRLFVNAFGTSLHPGGTDWDAEAWAEAQRTLPWIALLGHEDFMDAWHCYVGSLVVATQRLVASSGAGAPALPLHLATTVRPEPLETGTPDDARDDGTAPEVRDMPTDWWAEGDTPL